MSVRTPLDTSSTPTDSVAMTAARARRDTQPPRPPTPPPQRPAAAAAMDTATPEASGRRDAVRRRAIRQARRQEAAAQAVRDQERLFLRALVTSRLPLR
ncbi:hypothetical protein ACTXLV_12510 [Brachybacterium alimentarium]|uniref:hypothetical protein n=1 Tax=Brachybacterium alimentarium TaxID=47845 RepID=UPI003FD1FE9A